MELVYVYFEDFIKFKKEELILNNSFKVSFDKFHLSLNNIERLEERKSIYPNNVKNLNVLVGKNATGKSSILKLIKDAYFFRDQKYIKIYYIKSDKEKNEDIYRVYSTIEELKLDGESIDRSNQLEFGKNISVGIEGIKFIDTSTETKETPTVFISNYPLYSGFGSSIYKDSYKTTIERKGVIDISLIKTLIDVYEMNELFNNEKYVFYMEYIKIANYHSLNNFFEKRKKNTNVKDESGYKSFEFKTNLNVLLKINENLKSELQSNNNNIQINKLRALKLYFESLLAIYSVKIERSQEMNFKCFNDFIDQLNNLEILEDGMNIEYYIDKLLDVIDYIDRRDVVSYFSISKENLIILLNYLESELFVTNAYMAIHIKKETNNKDEFLNAIEIFNDKFVNCIMNTLFFQTYINPQNHETMIAENLKKGINYMSSAEESYLSLYNAINKALNENESASDTITFIFDEPENNMHPELATKFVNSLFMLLQSKKFINKEYSIVIATHSPFILSDILSEDIKYLERNECDYVTISSSEIKTFAGNIQDILKNSFFLSSTIGEFAKNEINKAIKLLKNDEIDDKKIEDIEFLISLIAEPIVKEYMVRLLSKRKKDYNLINEVDFLGIDERKLIFERLQKEFEVIE